MIKINHENNFALFYSHLLMMHDRPRIASEPEEQVEQSSSTAFPKFWKSLISVLPCLMSPKMAGS